MNNSNYLYVHEFFLSKMVKQELLETKGNAKS